MKPAHLNLFIVFASLHAGALITAGIHGAKLTNLGGLVFDAGLITFSITFIITDIVSELFGKKYSKKIIFGSLCALLCAYFVTQFILMLPADSQWELESEFSAILGTGSRIFIAALVTYVFSQLVDIWIFSYIRQKTGAKYLWLRNNLSTLGGGLVDAVVFSTIAFYGVYDVLPIIISAYTMRIIISILDTPLIYLIIYILRKKYPDLRSA